MRTEKITTPMGIFEISAADAGIRLSLKQYGAHQAPDLNMGLDCIRPGAMVIDLGAHIGTFAVPMALKAGATGHVVAVEGNPETYRILSANLRQNKLANVTAVNCIVSDEPASYRIDQLETKSHNTGAVRYAAVDAMSEGALVSATLEEVVADHAHRPVDFIKVDVEGMDFRALNSGLSVIRRDTPVVVFECYFARDGAVPFQQIFAPASYAWFTNLERSPLAGGRFEPFLLSDLTPDSGIGQRDIFAVPRGHEVFGRWSADAAEPEESAYREAKHALEVGRLPDAFRYVRKRSPFRHVGQALLAAAVWRRHDFAEAIAALRQGREMFPDDPEVLRQLSIMLRRSGAIDEALVAAEEAFRLAPAVADLALLYHDLLKRRNRETDAYEVLHSFGQRFGPHPRILFEMGGTLWRLRRRSAAIEACEESVKIKMANAPAQARLARYLASRHRLAEAIDHAALAVRFDSRISAHHLALAKYLVEAGRLKEALAAAKRACRSRPDDPRLETLLRELRAQRHAMERPDATAGRPAEPPESISISSPKPAG